MWRCAQCGAEGEDHFQVCWSCGMPRDGSEGAAEGEASGPDPAARCCPACGAELTLRGVRRMRLAQPGAWSPLRIAEDLGAGPRHVELWACPRCRKVELYEAE